MSGVNQCMPYIQFGVRDTRLKTKLALLVPPGFNQQYGSVDKSNQSGDIPFNEIYNPKNEFNNISNDFQYKKSYIKYIGNKGIYNFVMTTGISFDAVKRNVIQPIKNDILALLTTFGEFLSIEAKLLINGKVIAQWGALGVNQLGPGAFNRNVTLTGPYTILHELNPGDKIQYSYLLTLGLVLGKTIDMSEEYNLLLGTTSAIITPVCIKNNDCDNP